MIKVILFDCDGVIINRAKYFSQRLKDLTGADFGEREKPFFQNEFLLCEVGKADLKHELSKRLKLWGFLGTVEELMDFWFEGEKEIDFKMRDFIVSLRKLGVKCFLSTNNEKYRVDYLWNKVGLKNFLDGVYASCSVGYMKPQEEFWQEIYKNFSNTAKEEILVWDDERPTIDSAKAFGLNAEFYNNFEDFKKIMTERYQFYL